MPRPATPPPSPRRPWARVGRALPLGLLTLGLAAAAPAPPAGSPLGAAPAAPAAPEVPAAPAVLDDAAAVRDGITLLLGMQESLAGGDAAPAAEWPYEGVYRVRRRIPMGYRVGGTAICGTALLEAPGYADDPARIAAIDRSIGFVCAAVDDPMMQFPFPPAYDVRGWGYAYGLDFLLRLTEADAVPPARSAAVATAIEFFLAGIVATELDGGGWNYAMRAGSDRHAPFMTGPTLSTLFRARAAGHPVDAAMIDRGLAALAASRKADGAQVYSGRATDRSRDEIPGATGRMLSAEIALALAGQGDTDRLRQAVTAFFEHWEWLEKRRRQSGTHVAPYGIAPYYFFYAHHAAAAAIELLPEDERAAHRTALRARLAQIREDDGSWNDRVFPRSANYGTAMTMLALMMPETESGVRLEAPAKAKATGDAAAEIAAPAPETAGR